jgi:hypothetical protein
MGQCVAVIAGRGGYEAPSPGGGVEGEHCIRGAAELEATSRLAGFELEMDRNAEAGGKRRGDLERSRRDMAGDAGPSLFDLGKNDGLCHARPRIAAQSQDFAPSAI